MVLPGRPGGGGDGRRNPPPPSRPRGGSGGAPPTLPKRHPTALRLAWQRSRGTWGYLLLGTMLLMLPMAVVQLLLWDQGLVTVMRRFVWPDLGRLFLHLVVAAGLSATLLLMVAWVGCAFSALTTGELSRPGGLFARFLGRLPSLAPLIVGAAVLGLFAEVVLQYGWESGRAQGGMLWPLLGLFVMMGLLGLFVRLWMAAILVAAEGAPVKDALSFWQRPGITEHHYALVNMVMTVGVLLLADHASTTMQSLAPSGPAPGALDTLGDQGLVLAAQAVIFLVLACIIGGHYARLRYTPNFRVIH